MASSVVATVDPSVAAISVVVAWQEVRVIAGSVVDGANTKYAVGDTFPADVGSSGTRIVLPEGWTTLTAQLVVGVATNDIDLYITRNRVVIAAGVATGSTTELFTIGDEPGGVYEFWAYGYSIITTPPVGYTITLGVVPNGVPVHLFRVHPDGSEVEVLGSPMLPSGTTGQIVCWDTTAPLDVPVFYRAYEALSNVSKTSNTVTITAQGMGWLKDPTVPSRDIHLIAKSSDCPPATPTPNAFTIERLAVFMALAEQVRANASGMFPVVDGARDVTVAQLRKAAASVLSLSTLRLSQLRAMEEILLSGRVLLLQLDARYGFAYRNWASDYIQVMDATEVRVALEEMIRPQRIWRLGYKLARAPAVPTQLVGGTTIGPLGTTYGDATASGRTYAQRNALGNKYWQTSLGVGL
jgi:hypothetical protein